MPSLNKVLIIGNLGKDPEMKFTPSGKPVTEFSVAAGRTWTDGDGQRKEETEWFNVVTWNKTAENCNQFLTKGALVYVEGRLHTRSWEGQDGQKHYRTEVVADTVTFLDRKPKSGEAETSTGDEDIPFAAE
jgi:single-strand DNA-binding protein